MITKTHTYAQITFKASHNSYERSESIAGQLEFSNAEPWPGGCLGLEFDIWRKSSGYNYKTSMDKGYFNVMF